jgi:alkylhydroperoxidase family enzyme
MAEATGVRLPLPPGDGSPAAIALRYRPELAAALGELHASAARCSELDPVTTELVRLRCATWHNCRICKSLRTVIDGERAVDETLAAKVIDYENSDLEEGQKAALRLADAFMTAPARIADELRAEVLQHFTDAQVTEILLDIIAWTQQKPLVALALDLPADDSALTGITFDEAGHYVIGGTLG